MRLAKKYPNMRISFVLPFLALLLSAAQCSQKEIGCELGKPFQLQIGETMNCKDSPIQFVAIKEDSRCPEYVNCVWEGQVVIQLALGEREREMVDLTLREGKPALASQKVGAYIYRLEEVVPYPVSDKKIEPEDYSITLVVESI